jgi:tetratricopeptide (TPR) repeat protein
VRSFLIRRHSLAVLVFSIVGAGVARGETTPALPEWASLVQEGLRVESAGRLQEAAALFDRARVLAPNQAPPARAACQLALRRREDGEPVASREACHAAFLLEGQAQDVRGEVASTLATEKRTLADLALATLGAEGAVRKSPDQPWGYLARCDVGRSLGNADVVASCLEDLQRVAPSDPLTRRAFETSKVSPPVAVWLGRAALFAILAGTLLHWLLRRRAAALASSVPTSRTAARAALLFIGVGLLTARPAFAVEPKEKLGDIPIDDADPEASVPSVAAQNAKPLQFGYFLQDLLVRAERAVKAGDHKAGVRYYRALFKAAPKSSVGPRKLCEELEADGDLAEAVKACRTAITLENTTAADYVRFVGLVLAQPGTLPAAEKGELDQVIDHVAKEAKLDTMPARLRCRVALRFGDVRALEQCSTELERSVDKDNPETVSFRWALAVERHDHQGALAIIDEAKRIGMPEDGIARMTRATQDMRHRWLTRLGAVLFAAAALLVVGSLVLKKLSARRRALA